LLAGADLPWCNRTRTRGPPHIQWRKSMRKFLLAVALLAVPVLSAAAANNPWIGTWKLDPAKSQSPGSTITCSKAANGLMHYSNDDGWNFDFHFGIDGKEYKTADGYSVIWTAAGPSAWDAVVKFKGSFFGKLHHQLSADGKTLTLTEVGTRPDGSSYASKSVYTRESGSTGEGQGHLRQAVGPRFRFTLQRNRAAS
jgi:hypothetical protein